ncbi:cysteine-rich receptor-like protein kinase 10 [Silene latifolia]|uniref:cysteine-rich receptor-like protein kinase 10 n=1 Tax=Silene latifolia TaxID=37657 RepID=UPI003D786E34
MAFEVLFLILVLHVSISSCSDNAYVASKCEGNGVNPLELRSLFLGMSKAAGKTNYYALNTSGNGNDREVTMHGAYLCRGDVSSGQCNGCVSAAISHLFVYCKNAKSGVTWYEMCLVRFSTVAFFGIVNGDESIYKGTTRKMRTDKRAYLNLAGRLIQNMAVGFNRQDDNSGSYFKYQTETLDSSYVMVYTMAECTPDLSPFDCQMCLQILTYDIPALCSGSSSCWMLNPACIARYSSNAFLQTPVISPPPPTVPNDFTGSTPSLKRKRSLVLGIVIPLSIGLGILIISSLIYLHRKRREATIYGDLDGFGSLRSMIFTYASVKRATSNFAEVNKVGQGGFGEGKLSNGEVVAIKKLARNSGQGLDQFKNEVMLLARLQHKNLVKLIGFCMSKSERVLIYEFLPNSSLDRFLFGPRRGSLEWESRFRIIIGVAKAVLYLHEDSRLKIIHRDLKPSNILLDHQMNPKVADLGLARLFNDDQSQYDANGIVGTPGYMAPEYARQGKISAKSDVYSLGIVILEIVSGQRNGFSDQQPDEEGLIPRVSILT